MQKRSWQSRYSSCEWLLLDVVDDGSEVLLYLNHSRDRADRFSAAQVFAGEMDAEVRSMFGDAVVEELKAAVRHYQANPIRPETEADKQAKREARRLRPSPPKNAP